MCLYGDLTNIVLTTYNTVSWASRLVLSLRSPTSFLLTIVKLHVIQYQATGREKRGKQVICKADARQVRFLVAPKSPRHAQHQLA